MPSERTRRDPWSRCSDGANHVSTTCGSAILLLQYENLIIVEINDAAFSGRARRGGGNALCLQCLGVWRADTIGFALHRVNEGAVFAHEGVALHFLNRPSLPDVHHDFKLGHFNGHALTE